tara:strand:- start:113 stop:709 length:597 start_codon:yes stop_codon:yes gene_type:complete
MSLRKKYTNSTLLKKTCKKCNQTFPRTEDYFYRRKHRSKSGYFHYYPICITCENLKSRLWKLKNKEKKRLSDVRYKESERGYFNELWQGVRKSKHGSNFQSYEEFFQVWIDQQKIYGTKCPYKGYEMTRIKGINKNGVRKTSTNTNISKDRILSNQPYSKENLMFISWEANNEKGNITYDTAKQYIKFVEERFKYEME